VFENCSETMFPAIEADSNSGPVATTCSPSPTFA
jgi:hypothetical protein